MLGGLLVWAADFFLLYAIGSIFLDTVLARVLAGVVTLVALAADTALLLAASRLYRAADDDFRRWMWRVGMLGAALSLLAVAWQGFPAILM